MDTAQAGLLRSLNFFDVLGYAPTLPEVFLSWDQGSSIHNSRYTVLDTELTSALHHLIDQRIVTESRGRFALAGRESLIRDHEAREALFPRKLRRARQVAKWLAHLSGVRAIFLCNTTALAHADDQGDLDFFVITRARTIWQTRGLASLPFQLLDQRPRPDRVVRDAVCLSFFVDDDALNLSSLQLSEDDPYFRYWFLSLLPLYDDGVMSDLWKANHSLIERHSFARPWIVNPAVKISSTTFQIPHSKILESLARRLQISRFNPSIKQLMHQDTRVVVTDHVLKFHVDDGREKLRDQYYKNCQRYGIEA
ncbi:hypothetical protein EXS71_01820 [Candidatus Uhrbacteria bacterium]|nr:hypothetical protein [Candidatus Uhrbacteria bacterium]